MAEQSLPTNSDNLNVTEKRCVKCREVKPANQFWRRSASRDGLNYRCMACIASQQRQYKEVNPDKVRATKQKYREANRQKIRTQSAQYREANRDRIAEKNRKYIESNYEKVRESRQTYYYNTDPEIRKERDRRWRIANPDKVKAKALKYRAANSEKVALREREYKKANRQKINASASMWRKANPEKVAEHRNKQKAKRRSALSDVKVDLTSQQWEQIKEFYGHKCAFCREKAKLTQDHLVAISKGGEHTASNIIPLCLPCNASKGNRDVTKVFLPHLLMAVK